MAFTKTVNYIEGIPVSLNYSNEITETGNVTVLMTYDSAGGRLLSTNSNPNLTVSINGDSLERKDVNEWKVVGPVADVNAFLNQLEWMPRAYNPGSELPMINDPGWVDPDPEADPPNEPDQIVDPNTIISEDPLMNILGDTGQLLTVFTPYIIGAGKDEGEIEVDLYDQVGTFAVGDAVRLQKPDLDDELETEEYDYNFKVVKVEGTRIRLRWPSKIFHTLDWYKPNKLLCDPTIIDEAKPGEKVDLYQRVVKRNGATIEASGWVVDYSFNNAIGDYPINIYVNGNAEGITTMKGSLYSSRPTITGVPDLVFSNGRWAFTDDLGIGVAGDNDNAQLTVQLLIKRHENDPAYEHGNDFMKGKPSYLTDNSYGEFAHVRVGDRISKVADLDDTPIRWEFFGTVAECNRALSEVRLIDKKGESPFCVDPTDDDYPESPDFSDDWTFDYYIEVRVLDGWTRTFNSRGYK